MSRLIASKLRAKLNARRNLGSLNLASRVLKANRLHDADIPDRKFLKHDALITYGREVAAGGPSSCRILHPPVESVGGKGFEQHAHVPKIVKTQRDEIVLTNRYVEIFTLIVFDPFIFDPLTRLEPADSVRTRAQRPL
jgi:hypothetical protein